MAGLEDAEHRRMRPPTEAAKDNSPMRWLSDQILKILNFVPELINDPRFDVLRWWFLFVVIVVSLLIYQHGAPGISSK